MCSSDLLGALVFANMVMLFSGMFKNAKAATASAIVLLIALSKLSNTYSQIKLFYPLQFSTDAMVKGFFFLGNTLIPYSIIVLLLTILYITILALLIGKINKKYYLN